MVWQSHTSAERTSLSVHVHEVTSQGWMMRVSLEAADRSMTAWASGCACRNEAGIVSDIFSSTVFRIISAFSSPQPATKTFCALRIVAIPIVMEQGGTFSLLPKLSVISSLVVWSMRMMREVEVNTEPGSFVAMFPIRPILRSIMSMPPQSSMHCS